jgi:transposase
METPISWQAEARRLRATGKTSAEIAAKLGKSLSTVKEALRGTRRTPLAVLGAGRAGLAAPHAKRVIRVILDEQTLGSAAVAVRRRRDRPGGADAKD